MKWVALETSVIVICITVAMVLTKTGWPLFLLFALTTKVTNKPTDNE